MRLDVDPSLDPAAADPLVAQFRYALRRAFGADPSDATLGPAAVPLSVATRSWDRYSVLAYGNAPGSGVYVRPYVRLTGRAVSGPGLVKGRRMDALLGLELLRSEEHTSELQSLMRISYAVFCLKKKTYQKRKSLTGAHRS